jgi:addiction module HigA family antidote
MSELLKNEYLPDSVSSPGETLLELIEEKGMSQVELAKRTGRPIKTINEIIKGKAALTSDTAIQLERVLGVPADFWNQMEANYRTYLARTNEQVRLNEKDDWLKQFPILEMISRKCIRDLRADKTALKIELLNFFAVASPDQWTKGWGQRQIAFRKSNKLEAKVGPTSAWLRLGEIEAEKSNCSEFDEHKLRESLPALRALTRDSNPESFVPKLTKLCASFGVAVAFVPAFKGVPVCGATRWLTQKKAMVLLSLRYKTDDQLWFTFFHELGHILKHGKRDLFVDFDKKSNVQSQEEEEADAFASDCLIPQHQLDNELKSLSVLSREAVIQLASKLGISTGILVGRLQFMGRLPHSHLNDLKQRFVWTEEQS